MGRDAHTAEQCVYEDCMHQRGRTDTIDLRTLIVETMDAHRIARGWSYGGTNIAHDETHDYGIVCMCGWSCMSNERDVVHSAADAHRADEIADALSAAGFLRAPLVEGEEER